MSGKGEYRGVYVALIDSWEFQALSACARSCLLTLKLKLGKAGIDVFAPETLPRFTGFTADQCNAALDELKDANWLRSDRNVYWLRNGLRFDPAEPLRSPNQRTGILSHLKTLPPIDLVREFSEYYGLESSSGHPENGRGSERVNKGFTKPFRSTEDGRRKTEDGKRTPVVPLAGDAANGVSRERRTEPAKPRRASATTRPADWEPLDRHREKAEASGLDVEHEAEQFASYHDSRDSRFVSWDRAFDTWLGNAVRFATRRERTPDPVVGESGRAVYEAPEGMLEPDNAEAERRRKDAERLAALAEWVARMDASWETIAPSGREEIEAQVAEFGRSVMGTQSQRERARLQRRRELVGERTGQPMPGSGR